MAWAMIFGLGFATLLTLMLCPVLFYRFFRRQAKAGKPFFAVIWFHAPHLPVVSGKEFTEAYARFDKYKQHYYGCIDALDEQVGRVRTELRRLKVANDTMLLLGWAERAHANSCSANGAAFSSMPSLPGSL